MWIKNLRLKDFRNYGVLDINFSDKFNIIHGDNAQGKTNIIEAMFLCSSGRSHRTSRDQEMVRNGTSGFEVAILLRKSDSEEEIGVSFTPEEKKRIRINGIKMKKIGSLMGHLNAVMFSPEDLMIIKQGPAERRRFIDIAISQIKPAYFYELQQYARILFQRNTMLREAIDKRIDENMLDVWDVHLAKTGAKIIAERMSLIKRLDDFARLRHGQLTNHGEKLELIYKPSINIDKNSKIEDIEDLFSETICRNRKEELRKGTTAAGPHRDDIDILLNGENTKVYGSQGQQRTSILSVKLGEIDLIKEEIGEFPVLLLDDVLSELDAKRKEYLMDSVDGLQVFITCTDRKFYSRDKKGAVFFHVRAGKVDTERE
ncbi:MAG: DNA replication/repair protein RecF [Bacillota bacterium]